MAKLPTAENLGVRTFQDRSQVITPSVDLGGQGQLVSAVGQFSQQINDRLDRVSLNKAKINFQKAKLEADNAFDQDPDFETHQVRYDDMMGKAMESSSKLVRNSQQRQDFEGEMSLYRARGNQAIKERAFSKEVDRGIADVNETLTTGRENYLRSTDPADRQFSREIMIDAIDEAFESGYLSADQVRAKKESLALDLAKTSVSLESPEKQLELLNSNKGIIATIPVDQRTVMISRAAKQFVADKTVAINAASEKAYRAARNGNSPDEHLLMAFDPIDDMVAAGQIDESRANSMKREIERETDEQLTRKSFDDIVELDGFDAAFDELESISKSIPEGWTPDEWNKYITAQQKDLNRKFARHQFNNKESVKAAKKTASVERGLLFMDPNIPADPAKSSQDRKDVNAAYEQESEEWSGLPAQEVVDNHVSFIQNTGIVPDRVISNVNAAMRSGSNEQVSMTMDLVSRLEEMPNAANALRDFPDESRSLSLQIADSARAGISTDDAIEIARKNTFGMTAQQKEVIKINTQEVAKQLSGFLASAVDEKFDPSIIPFFGEEPDIPTNMQADYNVAFDKFMTLTNGNTEQAKSLAFGSVQKIWAITDIGGDNRFMRHAPEAYYAVDGFDNEWIDRQFLADMESKGVLGAQLSSDADTGRGNKPSYPIVITNEQGIPDIARDKDSGLPLRWQPDFNQSEEFIEIQQAPGKAIETAKKKRAKQLERRANYLRRNVQQRAIVGKGITDNASFMASEEGQEAASRAIGNLLALEKIDKVEAKHLREAFGVEELR